MPRALALLLLAIAASGCVGQVTPASITTPAPVLLDEEGLLDGALGRSWEWEVHPGYQTFRVCVMFEGAGQDAAVVILPRVRLRHDHDQGFEVHGRSELVSVSAPGCWFAFEGGGPGAWALQLDAQGGRARWVAQVDVVY